MRWIWFYGALLAAVCSETRGGLSRTDVDNVKRAVARVALPPGQSGRVNGTPVCFPGTSYVPAVCIDGSGLFIGSEEIARAAVDGQVRLVLNPSQRDEKTIRAEITSVDPSLRIAVLKAPAEAIPYPSLKITSEDTVHPDMKPLCVGFPLGSFRALESAGDPPPVNFVSTILRPNENLPGDRDRLAVFGNVHLGHTGGPLLDPVLGCIVGLQQPSDPKVALPTCVKAKYLRSLLARPLIQLAPPALPTLASMCDEQIFAVQIIPPPGPANDPRPVYSVEAMLSDSGGGQRRFVAELAGDGAFHFRAVPLARGYTGNAVRLSVALPDGLVACDAPDVEVKINGYPMPISRVRRIERGSAPSTTLTTGEQFPLSPIGLGPIRVERDGKVTSLDLSKAHRIDVDPFESAPRSVRCTINVLSGGKVVASLERTLASTAPLSPLLSLELREVHLDTGRTERILPAPADDLFAGAGGRLLFLKMNRLRKIAVFNVCEAKLVKMISLGSDETLAAANGEKLILIDQAARMIHRWDLRTLEREATAALPDLLPLESLAAGYASDRYVGFMTSSGPWFFDVQTLKMAELATGESALPWTERRSQARGLQLRASADGTAFVCADSSPLGVLRIGGGGADVIGPSNEDNVSPSYDGTFLLGPRGARPVSDLRFNMPMQDEAVNLIPTYHPDYVLRATFNPASAPGQASQPPRPSLAVYRLNGFQRLVELPELPELTGIMRGAGTLPVLSRLQKRVHFYPWANLLITLAPANDKLILRDCALPLLLQKAGCRYLIVTSVPDPVAQRGQAWRYAPKVHSDRHGGIQFTLLSGPEGMVMTEAGVLKWNVPEVVTSDRVNVILSIHNGFGEQVYHSFWLALR